MKNINILLLILATVFIWSCKDDEVTETPDNGIKLPRKELRGVWIASVDNIDWPSKKTLTAAQQQQEFIDYLESFKKYNINAIFMQIRPTADAFYPSTLEPWSQFFTGTQGTSPGYDPLDFMIKEAHKRGIEFHAWINPYRIANNHATFAPAASHIYKTHAEWTMIYNNKLLMFRPALPEVRSFFFSVVEDIITKYDVDGIHLDDYFYPYPAAGATIDDIADYDKYGKSKFASIEDFRRDNVNQAIEGVHKLIKAKRPDVLFSVSPYAVWRNRTDDPNGSNTSDPTTNYDALYADIRLWCEKGWLDFVIPQLYASTENSAANFKRLVEWWPKNTFNTPVMVGYPLYKFGVAAEGAVFQDPIELEMLYFYGRRQVSIQGGILYNASAIKNNKIDICTTLAKVHAEPTLIPFMGRKSLPDPKAVANLKVASNVLTWDNAGTDLRYAVYKVDSNIGKLVTVITANTYTPAESGEYVVTVINKDNTESPVSDVVKVQ